MESLKCVIIGDRSVGKTSMLISFTSNSFPSEYIPTIFDNYSSNILVNNKIVNLGLWDTAGQEDYDRIRPLSYPKTDIFILCFSVVDRKTFLNIKDKYYPEISHHCPNIPFIICGTKIDLRDDYLIKKMLKSKNEKAISLEEGKELVRELSGIKYLECSSYLRINIDEIFKEVASIYLDLLVQKKKKKCKKCILL